MLNYNESFKETPLPGRFGAIRKHDIHTGFDFYCPIGTEIPALESGVVVAIESFTGEKAGSPWWHETQAVLVEGPSGVILYGEILPKVKVGQEIRAKEIIGTVLQVLKRDKGKPLAMLHLEWYTSGTKKSVWWYHNEPQPKNILNVENLPCLKVI